MMDEHVIVSVSARMQSLIRALDDAEFDTVVTLIEQLPESLVEFLNAHPAALSAITRVSRYAFVCIRKPGSNNEWIVVDIYEDGDPDGPPHGGGRGAFDGGGHVRLSLFPSLPQEFVELFDQACDVEEMPVLPIIWTDEIVHSETFSFELEKETDDELLFPLRSFLSHIPTMLTFDQPTTHLAKTYVLQNCVIPAASTSKPTLPNVIARDFLWHDHNPG